MRTRHRMGFGFPLAFDSVIEGWDWEENRQALGPTPSLTEYSGTGSFPELSAKVGSSTFNGEQKQRDMSSLLSCSGGCLRLYLPPGCLLQPKSEQLSRNKSICKDSRLQGRKVTWGYGIQLKTSVYHLNWHANFYWDSCLRFSTSCYKKYGANAQAIATAAENSQNKLKVRQDKLSGIF